MFKKIVLPIVGIAMLVGASAVLFKEQLTNLITNDMFVAADTDSFDPGLTIGSQFPAISAQRSNIAVSSIDNFIHDKGMVFVANRSVSW
ncbi:MAG: hypothetical protein AB8B86_09100 [Pseudomonadales bacterium]